MNAVVEEGREIGSMMVEESTTAVISRAEIDQQIATAKKYPRSIKRFMDTATAMVTLNESIAQQCIYALPRDGKTIEGASARFGEIIANAWGNCRAGARVVNEGAEFITAQGVFHDLENNVAITYEVQRRITDKQGRRFKPDMIGVTANAACSIALRNSILKGVPKAFWEPLYHKARAVVAGNITTLANKRAEAIKQFAIFGVTEPQIIAKLGRDGVADITVDDLVTLFGLLTAIRDGDTTPEQAFATDETPQQKKTPGQENAAKPFPQDTFDKELPKWRKAIESGKRTADNIIAMARTGGTLSDEQIAKIKGGQQKAEQSAGVTFAAVVDKLNNAEDIELLDVAADLIKEVDDEAQRDELTAIYHQRRKEMGGE